MQFKTKQIKCSDMTDLITSSLNSLWESCRKGSSSVHIFFFTIFSDSNFLNNQSTINKRCQVPCIDWGEHGENKELKCKEKTKKDSPET